MKNRWHCLKTCCLLCAWALSVPGAAHLMPAQQGSVNVLGHSAFVVLAPPVSALKGADTNGDGRLSAQELAQHHALIEAQVRQGFQLYADDALAQVDFIQVSAEEHEGNGAELPAQSASISAPKSAPTSSPLLQAGARHVLVLLKWSWAREDAHLRLQLNLFGKESNQQQFSIKILRDKQTEVAVLTPHHPEHVFFRGRAEIFQDYVVLGVEHILTGWDHLLFLFTLIIATQAARSWRYWLAVLSSFTVAHSITLGLSLFGVVQPPVMAVEALIMLSISLMAAINLSYTWRVRRVSTSTMTQAAIVFACGLLHGFGFAAAMSAMGLHADYRSLSLLAFNVGIELGQIVFLLAVLVGAALCLRMKWVAEFVPRGRVVLNGAILLLSLVVFVLRLGEFV